jgi:hypothetical protein
MIARADAGEARADNEDVEMFGCHDCPWGAAASTVVTAGLSGDPRSIPTLETKMPGTSPGITKLLVYRQNVSSQYR